MRKPYSKLLRKKFSEMVRGLELPFEEFSGKSEYLLPIDYAHVHRVNEKLWLFLVLYINPKGRQCFTVQFGWSTLGRFPEVLDMRFPDLEVKKERFREKEHFQRVAVFLGHDQWWYLEGDKKNWLGHLDGDPIDLTSEDVERSVNKAIGEVRELLTQKVVPHLVEFIESLDKRFDDTRSTNTMTLDSILAEPMPSKFIDQLVIYATNPNLGGVAPKDLEQAPPLVKGAIFIRAFDMTIANSGIWKWFVELHDDYPDFTGFLGQIQATRGIDYFRAAEALFPNGRVPEDDDERFDYCDEHGREFHQIDRQYKGAAEDAILKFRDHLIAHRSLFEKEVEEFWKVRKANKGSR